jgi:hypothetical protein
LELYTCSSKAGERRLEALVHYAGAEEWYTVTGSPLPVDVEDHRVSHEAVLARLTTPGPVYDGNEQPVDLRGWQRHSPSL